MWALAYLDLCTRDATEATVLLMNVSELITNLAKATKSNAPEILAAVGITGVFTTSYLAAKAAVKVAQDEDADPHASNKEKIKKYWKLYIPAGLSGALTVGAIVGSNQASGRRTAAAVTAYAVTEKAFSEYKERVIEQVGKNTEHKVREKVVQGTIDGKPPSTQVIFAGKGHVLCCETYTRRYFRSDMETLKRAQNEINQRVHTDLYVMLSEFYDLIGLEHTSASDFLGWKEKEMELNFFPVLSEGPNSEPCLGFDYEYVTPL
jgi:hypothetical protein